MFQEQYIEWHELTPAQRAQAEVMFSATKLIGGRFDAYVYMVGKSGTVVCRRFDCASRNHRQPCTAVVTAIVNQV